MPNKNLRCVRCGNKFIFSEEEQDFYRKKRFEEPKRCRACRKKKSDRYDVGFITKKMMNLKARYKGGRYGFVNDFCMD